MHYYSAWGITIVKIILILAILFLLTPRAPNASPEGTAVCPNKTQCDPFHDPIPMAEAIPLALAAGFEGGDAATIVAIAWAESGGNPFACFYNPPRRIRM